MSSDNPNDIYKDIFNVDPCTLNVQPSRYESLVALYDEFGSDLRKMAREMQNVRDRMTAIGCRARFGDCDSEILYLMIRKLKPDVVVEISPMHGYSTNYILAALTDNRKGELHSFEILTEFNGRPIRDQILDNISPCFDTSRLKLVIGDARQQDIPDCDVLFMDSCHESVFAAWYLSRLVCKPRFVMVHDIAIYNNTYKALAPKGHQLGIREQYYLLESLSLNHERFFSVSQFRKDIPASLRKEIPVRNPDQQADMCLGFKGHEQNQDASRMHTVHQFLEGIRRERQQGDLSNGLQQVQRLIASDCCLFSKLNAAMLIPLMGYRYPVSKEMFPHIDVDYRTLSISNFASLLELALVSWNFGAVRCIASCAKKANRLMPAYRFVLDYYLGVIVDCNPSLFRWLMRKFRLKILGIMNWWLD